MQCADVQKLSTLFFVPPPSYNAFIVSIRQITVLLRLTDNLLITVFVFYCSFLIVITKIMLKDFIFTDWIPWFIIL